MADGGLRQLISKHISAAHWVAIESPLTSRGIPDLNGCLNGTEVWIETKAIEGWTVAISKEQVAWIERRSRALGRVYVAVRRSRASGLWLLNPSAARPLLEGQRISSLPADAIRLYSPGGPAAWDWYAIKSLIFQR